MKQSLHKRPSFKKLVTTCVVSAAVGLSACTYLPSSGPLSTEISTQSNQSAKTDFPFTLVELDETSIVAVLENKPKTFSSVFGNKAWKPRSVIGTGDLISVVVWEASDQGLFANPTTGSRTELGPFQVDTEGKIAVPFVGRITARGRSLAQLRWAIQSALQQKAVDPQVVVSITENFSNTVSVNGNARAPGQFPLSLSGDRLSDIVARANGTTNPVHETSITLVRKNRKHTQQLKFVLNNPEENIYVRANDQILLAHDPMTITAFGAVPRVGEYPLKQGRVSLIKMLGRIGGLDDNRADAAGLFVFRYEDRVVLDSLALSDNGAGTPKVPVIYKLNMKNPRSYFVAQSFILRDSDIVYVANAGGAELRKFISIISGVTGTALGVAAATN
ncbi:MAG: polysaccharide biosynthesis/export family protein [Pseudomonadota bacterium]